MDSNVKWAGRTKRSSTNRLLAHEDGSKAKFTAAQIRKNSRYTVEAKALFSQPVTDAEVRVLLLRLRDDVRSILRRGLR